MFHYNFPVQSFNGYLQGDINNRKINIQDCFSNNIAVVDCSCSIFDENMFCEICSSMSEEFFFKSGNEGRIAVNNGNEPILVRYKITFSKEYLSERFGCEYCILTPEAFINFFIDEFNRHDDIEAFHIAKNKTSMIIIKGNSETLIDIEQFESSEYGKEVYTILGNRCPISIDLMDFIDNTILKFIAGYKEFSTFSAFTNSNVRFIRYYDSMLKLIFKSIHTIS